jgi:PhnB protein
MEISSKSLVTSLTPWLSVRKSAEAVEFYKKAFGATEVYRLEEHGRSVVARLSIDDAEFWVSEEAPPHGNFSPQTLYGSTARFILTVADPDAMVRRALDAGASEIHAVIEEHGRRFGRVADPFGHHWEIGRPMDG